MTLKDGAWVNFYVLKMKEQKFRTSSLDTSFSSEFSPLKKFCEIKNFKQPLPSAKHPVHFVTLRAQGSRRLLLLCYLINKVSLIASFKENTMWKQLPTPLDALGTGQPRWVSSQHSPPHGSPTSQVPKVVSVHWGWRISLVDKFCDQGEVFSWLWIDSTRRWG